MIPFLSKIGNEMNSANEGITNQNILIDNPDIFSVSFVSIYNHVNASTDTIGIEAIIPPISELLLEISDISTIKIAVIANLIM